jgi:type II secretory pathway pseudopilin PulG
MKNLKKYSFSLIELVVAIVIIGIVVTAIPAVLTTSGKTAEINLKEKSFFNAYSLVTLLQSQYWDENNTKGDNYYKVLTADNGDSELMCERTGVIEVNNSSGAVCATDDNKTSALGVDSDEDPNDESTFDDIDDFNNYSTEINDFNISVRVKYWDDSGDYTGKRIYLTEKDTPVSGTNLKNVEIIVKSKSNPDETIAVLKYFTSNIGMVKIERRNE